MRADCLSGRSSRCVFRFPGGFTLIELLIVVAIIAILAAIAVPNFLEAQVRAKVSRAAADLRTIATALESYAVDYNKYAPNDDAYNTVPKELTTPVAYLSTMYLVDPFSIYEIHPTYGDLARYYTYFGIITYDEFLILLSTTGSKLPVTLEPVDTPPNIPGNVNALMKYGRYRMASNGPDRLYVDPYYVFGSNPEDPWDVLMGSDTLYDATNGTASIGNILYTQRDGLRR